MDGRVHIATRDATALSSCMKPTDGMWPLLEAGAARIDHVEIVVDEVGADGLRARWSVTVRLQDVGALRELATRPPWDAGTPRGGAQSLAVAWARAADPVRPRCVTCRGVVDPGPRSASNRRARERAGDAVAIEGRCLSLVIGDPFLDRRGTAPARCRLTADLLRSGRAPSRR